ncbi:hypothetical protein GIX45_22330 [Erwinia sp. CPCC 100877]|nr:hypothetical protein [Erwinia sp. CPCC 100877]
MNKVITVCPYCASGCKMYQLVEEGKVVGAEPVGASMRGYIPRWIAASSASLKRWNHRGI